MKRHRALLNFLFGCATALAAVLVFLSQEGFDDSVGMAARIATIAGVMLFGGLVMLVRSHVAASAQSFRRRAREDQ